MNIDLDETLRGVGLTADDLARVAAAAEQAPDPAAAVGAFRELAPMGLYPARQLVREPHWLASIAAGAGRPRDAASMGEAIEAELGDSPTSGELYRALRLAKRRESLRIYLRELRGASMRETTAEYADLAEATMRVAARHVARLSFPSLVDEFCVLGMGKLGGRELNPSSDVDLVFVCGDRAMEDDALRADVAAYARAFVDAIAAQTSDGYVFRVDLRLRPDGSQGPIVLPRQATADYYLQFGRTWERSAMMKARPIAGNDALGESMLRAIEPFVYRRYLDFGALEELRAMKAKIEANASLGAVHGVERSADAPLDPSRAPLADRLKSRLRGSGGPRRAAAATTAAPSAPDEDVSGVLGWDVKIGVGGIREIEFFVQALQLVHSGTQPTLRVRNTLEALDALLWTGLMTDADHRTLADAYDFLRRLEHRIQMAEDRQSHALPDTWAGFDIFARRCDEDPAALRTAILSVRERVRAIFERLFGADERGAKRPTLEHGRRDLVELIVRAGADQLRSDGTADVLGRLGFRRPRQVAGQLEVLRSKSWGPFRESAWGSDLELTREIFGSAAAAPDPDQAMSHFARFAQAVGDRPGYWTMLAENPHSTRLLLQVFGSSAYLAGALIADPNVFERLLAVGNVTVEKSALRMRHELEDRLERVDDPEHRLGVIRRYHREEMLRVGLHETGGAARVEETLEQLSLLAEVVIDRVLIEVYEPLRTRRRRPGSVLPPLDEIPFCVVAMGKLGGRELGFGSDLDVVFVYEEDRQWKLEHTFYARLAQRLIRTLSATGAHGKLYEVDTRLRPSGNRGALVVSRDAFRAYYAEGAALWERQALIRARPISGPDGLRAQIAALRADVAFGSPASEAELAEIARMRDRIEQELYQRGSRDAKYGPGGLVDVEFATQAAQLAAAAEGEVSEPSSVESGRRSQSTRLALLALTGSEALAADYMWLCRLQARLRMASDGATSVIPEDTAALVALARRMGHQGDGAAAAFLEQFDAVTARTLAFFEGVFA